VVSSPDRRDAEVGEQRVLMLLVPQDVARAHVAVKEPVGVGDHQGRRHLAQHLLGLRDREPAFGLETLLHGTALHVLHDEVGPLVGQPPEALDRHHVRIRGQRRRRPRFALESAPHRLVTGLFRVQDLDGDQDAQHAVPGEIHGGHLPAAQRAQDFEVVMQGGAQSVEGVSLGASGGVLGLLGRGGEVLHGWGLFKSSQARRTGIHALLLEKSLAIRDASVLVYG